MVKSLIINNFKAFGFENNTIELRPVTVIVGKNNSGKSSILKLLSILSTMSEANAGAPMMLNNGSVCLGSRFQDLFHNNDTSSMSVELQYADDKALKFNYLMNEGELYVNIKETENTKPVNENISKATINPFKAAMENHQFSNTGEDPFKFSADYIGPLRQPVNRNIQLSGGESDVYLHPDGSNVCQVLLASFNSDKKLFRKVADWFAENLECLGMGFDRNSETSGSYSLSVRHGDATVNLADVGQGIGQVLPIIVSSYMERHSDITIIEQPVLHLHPAAHQSVAERIVESAIAMQRNFITETHSYNFLLALRDMVANPEVALTSQDVIIYSVEQDEDESWLKPIYIESNGELSDWSEGVFAESYELLKSIKSRTSTTNR